MKDYEEKVLNIMDSTKVNIIAQLNRAYKDGYADAKTELRKNAINIAHEESDRAYQKGLEDAWEAAKKIHALQIPYEVFGLDKTGSGFTYASPLNLREAMTAQEAIAKIKEYEEQHQKFAVGDEVYSDAFDNKGIITHITADKVSCVCIICNGSTMMKVGTNGLHKTGRTFPQIAEVLTEMRGEKE